MNKPVKSFKILSVLSILCVSSIIAQNKDKPNVLFIYVDDLRPSIGAFGDSTAITPNIDALAAESRVFENHYVTVPNCGPSRYTLLTGKLPKSREQLRHYVFRDEISNEAEQANPETFIHHLKRNGYYTVGMGKVSHYIDGLYEYDGDPEGAPMELPYSWDEFVFDAGKWETGWKAFFAYADGSSRQGKNRKVKPYEKADVKDTGYPDGLTTNLALKKMKELSSQNEPFFLGVGLFKPHLPFNAPKKYWDLYERENIPLTSSPDIPENVNKKSLHSSNEFNRYLLGEEKASLSEPLSEDYARKIKHAYYASVSYIDAQIGKILDELEHLDLADNTVVVLWGDHGWHLGDHRVWGKHTVFEKSLNSPLIIKSPNLSDPGAATDKIVSSIDIYPTLMDLCNVETPSSTEGKSMVGLLDKPQDESWDEAAYSYFRDGISVRTKSYRLTKYFRDETPLVELYDHKNDPNENKNVAKENPEIVEKLDEVLESGNTGIYSEIENKHN